MINRQNELKVIIFWLFIGLIIGRAALYSLDQQDNWEQAGLEEEKDPLRNMSLEALMNIKITTAGKTEQTVRETPASVVVITREEIERYGYQSLIEILENVPGLYLINSRAYFENVFGVRGYWSRQPSNFIILVNHIEQADTTNMYQMQNINLPVEAIDRIEVIRGPMSVMYGSGTFFGAINIITNCPYDGEPNSLISASIGSEKTKRAAFRYAHTHEDLKLVFNAGYHDTYGPNEPLSKMVSDISTLLAYNISEFNHNTTTDGRLESNTAYFNFSGSHNGFFADLSLNRSAREEYHFWPSFSDGLLNKKELTIISFGYKRNLSEKLSLKGIGKYHLSSYWREFDYFTPDFFGQELENSRTFEVEINTEFKPIDTMTILTGFNYKDKETIDKLDIRTLFQLSTGTYNDGIRNIALFSQIDYSPIGNLKLVIGARLEKQLPYHIFHQDNQNQFILRAKAEFDQIELVPRVALLYALNDNHVIKLMYGEAVKLPSHMDFVQQKIGDSQDLKPEYINTLELNYISMLSSRFSLNVSLFHNVLRSLIVTVLGFKGGVWSPTMSNSGKLVSNGLEIMLQSHPVEEFSVELSGIYQKSKDKRPGFENRDVEYSPDFLGYLKASYEITSEISLALSGKYVGAMEPAWDVVIGGRIGKRVDGYFTLDGNLRLDDLFGKGYFFNVRCSNLFDTDYLYPIDNNNRGWADKGTFGNGRLVMITIGKNF